MKSIILFVCLFISIHIQAQSTIITSTITVKGNCDECKARIENAADIKGVKNCVWNESSQVATITYDSKKVTLAQIETSIAKAGHQTSGQEKDSTAYKALPECCKYEHTKHPKK